MNLWDWEDARLKGLAYVVEVGREITADNVKKKRLQT